MERSSSRSLERVLGSIDLCGRHRRTANVEDHVPRLLLRGVHTERHLSPPLSIDPPDDCAQPLEVLLREVHDAEVEIEFVFRRLALVEPQRNWSVQFVIELLESVDDLS